MTTTDADLGGLPACCYALASEPLPKRLYAAYNRSGAKKGLNYQGLPCPLWEDLPEDVQAKWSGAAMEVYFEKISGTP